MEIVTLAKRVPFLCFFYLSKRVPFLFLKIGRKIQNAQKKSEKDHFCIELFRARAESWLDYE